MATYNVLIHFAVGSGPQVVGRYKTLVEAEREARAYLMADAKGIWIEYPQGHKIRIGNGR